MLPFSTRTIGLLLLLCQLGSCLPAVKEFTVAETCKATTYAPVLQKLSGMKEASDAVPRIRRITVYQTDFKERLVESGSTIDIATLNQSSHYPTVSYLPPRAGYRQSLYLARVEPDTGRDVWFYYSFWYRTNSGQRDTARYGREEQYGYGPAYVGYGDEKTSTIHFTHALSVDGGDEGHYFRLQGKRQFFFVYNKGRTQKLRINRIVMEENNKYGGPRPYVFRIDEHFPDLQTLDFNLVCPVTTDRSYFSDEK